ncbi:group II intron maturase-specific domain-containing protein, partial [Methylomagnum sp.]
HISHDWLLGNVPMEKPVLAAWLKCGFMEKTVWSATDAGTPQGGIISPTLANFALDGLEQLLSKTFYRKRRHGEWVHPKVHLIRYADDFVITGSSKELLVDEVKPLLERFLAERGLSLSVEKTKVTHIEDGFDFLGQNVRKYDGKLLIKASAANYSACVEKIRTIIKSHKTAKQATLIKKLNPVIQGWANFHRHVVAARQFQYMDRDIWRALWRWAKRRHPNKNNSWIRERYFHVIGGRTWVFACERGDRIGGERRWIELRRASDTKIKRHTVIRADANPFDPEWETYFEDRIGTKMKANLAGRKRLLHLWSEQEGKCPVCGESLTNGTGWHVHHIVRRVDGGSNQRGNLVMVHPNCHSQIHSLGLEVVKPAPAMGL